jgi:hypothetical protein
MCKPADGWSRLFWKWKSWWINIKAMALLIAVDRNALHRYTLAFQRSDFSLHPGNSSDRHNSH